MNGERKGLLIAAVVLAIGVVFAVLYSSWAGEVYDDTAGNSREAVAQCEGFADKRLKSPATADYDLSASESDDGWTVTGTVDSENAFGAQVRSDVTCVLHFEADRAVLDDISID